MDQATNSSTPQAPSGPISILTCAACGKKNRIRPSERGAPHCGSCGKPLPWLVNATDASFSAEERSSVAVLVDLWAPWCGPCRIVEPGVERAAGSLAGRLKVVKVNLDQAPRTAERLGVQGIPTLLLLRDGREVARQVGAVPPPALLRWAEEAIAKPAA
jgi:thioredoxin 2